MKLELLAVAGADVVTAGVDSTAAKELGSAGAVSTGVEVVVVADSGAGAVVAFVEAVVVMGAVSTGVEVVVVADSDVGVVGVVVTGAVPELAGVEGLEVAVLLSVATAEVEVAEGATLLAEGTGGAAAALVVVEGVEGVAGGVVVVVAV